MQVMRALFSGGLPLAKAETGAGGALGTSHPLGLSHQPTSPHSAPRILWLPVLQSVIPIHIQVRITVRVLFAAAHDEAGACGKQSVRRTSRKGVGLGQLLGTPDLVSAVPSVCLPQPSRGTVCCFKWPLFRD